MPSQPPPASRLVFVLAVLAGVVLMHSLVLSPHSPGEQEGHHAASSVIAAVITVETPDPGLDCDVGSECSDAWVLHACAAILAVVITGAAVSAFRRAIAILRIGLQRSSAPPRVEQWATKRSVPPVVTGMAILRL